MPELAERRRTRRPGRRFRKVEREGGLSRCVTTTFGLDAMEGIFALAFWARKSLPGGHPLIILGREGKGDLGSHREDQSIGTG